MNLPATTAAGRASQSAYLMQDLERMAKAENYLAWQSRLVTPEIGRRVVEVGCGLGNFTSALFDRDAVVALDVDPYCIERLQQRYPGRANLHTFVLDAMNPDDAAFSGVAAFQPDSCVCLNALEHIEDDYRALARMRSLVVPGGVVVLLVPAFQALYGPTDKNLGHFRRYSRLSIRDLASAAGLRMRKLHYVNSIGFFGWWVNARLLRHEAQSAAQIAIFDRLIVPALSRLEALAPPPFGQSLFVVLEKP
ncbi:MAG: class I SAM-dependent methyltransferase [Bryobacteraceae bacterium]